MTLLRPHGAPTGPSGLSVCPHCWNVNARAERLCARCGADMAMALQESGGLRFTAPVQSPMPVRRGSLSRIQRAVILAFLALLAAGYAAAGFGHLWPRGEARPDTPATQPVNER